MHNAAGLRNEAREPSQRAEEPFSRCLKTVEHIKRHEVNGKSIFNQDPNQDPVLLVSKC